MQEMQKMLKQGRTPVQESVTDDQRFMDMALHEAEKAAEAGDVPVGAVLVLHTPEGDRVLSAGHNTNEQQKTAIGHAEIHAIEAACQAMQNWRLADCTLYVTLEPCPMCAGAIRHARIPRVVCGTKDPVAGAMGSVWAIHHHPTQKDSVQVTYGCREQACRDILQIFFQRKRGDSSSSYGPWKKPFRP